MFFIKPLINTSEDNVILDRQRCIQNTLKSLETNIYLDLNIVSKMRKVMEQEEKYEDTFLVEFVDKVSQLPGVFISPSLAFDESDKKYEKRNCNAFEQFLSKYIPQFHDAYNWRPYKLHNRSSKFENLTLPEKTGFSPTYSSILLMHYINLDKESSNLDKFILFLDLIVQEMDVIDGLPLVVGQYFFVIEVV